MVALNKPDSFILALVQVRESGGDYQINGNGCVVRYVKQPFEREPDLAASSVNYEWRELWERGYEPQRHKGHEEG